MKNALAAGSILLAGVLAANAAAAQEATAQARKDDEPAVWRASAGANYSEGKYGDTATTKVVSAPVAIKYRKGGFSVRLSVPWVHVNGPGSILDTPQGRDAGFGDLCSGDDNGSGGSGSDDSSGSGSGGSGSGGRLGRFGFGV